MNLNSIIKIWKTVDADIIKAGKKIFKRHVTDKKFKGKKHTVAIKVGSNMAIPPGIAQCIYHLCKMIFEYEMPMDVCLYIGIAVNGGFIGIKNWWKHRHPKGGI